jgi:hypothetical protein
MVQKLFRWFVIVTNYVDSNLPLPMNAYYRSFHRYYYCTLFNVADWGQTLANDTVIMN